MNILFNYLIFPGFIFTISFGMIASWIDRKVTARVQWRKGPPFLQPLYDVLKLLGKETIIPEGASRVVFLLAPLFALSSVVLVSTILWKSILYPKYSFLGDLIVIIYLLTIPAISTIVGGFASASPYASLGASREIKLMLSYELPFLLAVLVPIVQSGFTLRFGSIVFHQMQEGIVITKASGIIAFIVAILCMQAKLTIAPFDIPEAETEIVSGPYVEYSGTPLALFKMTKMMMLFAMPMLLVTLFMGGIIFSGGGIIWGIVKYLLLLVIIILIKNTNPRLRIDQATRFFWGPVTGLAIIAVLLALMGY